MRLLDLFSQMQLSVQPSVSRWFSVVQLVLSNCDVEVYYEVLHG